MVRLPLRSYLLALLVLATTGLALPRATGQAAPPTRTHEILFSLLFPKYTGMNGYEDLLIAADLARDSVAVPPAEQPGATLKEMREALADPIVDRAMKLVRAGLDKPIRTPRDLDKIDEETRFPEYSAFRGLARIMAMEEYVALADGRVSTAIDTMRDGLRFGYILQGELLIPGLTGISIDAIVLERLAGHFDQMSLRDCNQVIGIAQEWLKQPNPMETEIDTEYRSLVNRLNGWGSDPARFRKMVKQQAPVDPPTSEDEIASLELGDYVESHPGGITTLLNQAMAVVENDHRAIIEAARKPAWQRKPLPKTEPRTDMAHRLSAAVSFFTDQLLGKFDIERTKIHLLGVQGAIHRFRWENNRLPADLAELKLPDLITDPCTGKPFLYKVTAGAYEVYSPGPNSGGAGPIYLPRKPQ